MPSLLLLAFVFAESIAVAAFGVDLAVANDRLPIVEQGIVSSVVDNVKSVLNLPVPADVETLPMVWSAGELGLTYTLAVTLTNKQTVRLSVLHCESNYFAHCGIFVRFSSGRHCPGRRPGC